MNADDSYIEAKAVVDRYLAFNVTCRTLLGVPLARTLLTSPDQFYKIFAWMYGAARADSVQIVPKDIEQLMRRAYDDATSPDERDYDSLNAYLAPLPEFAIARMIRKRLPTVDFESLLAIHAWRKTEFPFFKDKKLVTTGLIALFALFQRSDLKIAEDLVLKIPYEKLNMDLVWLGIFVLAIPVFLYFFGVHSEKQRLYHFFERILLAGKIQYEGKTAKKE